MVDLLAQDVRRALRHADELVAQLLRERHDLLTAVVDLLAFQREAMDLIGGVGWPGGHVRRVEGLVEQHRRPTPAIIKVREAVFHFVGPEQKELPLAPRGDPRQSLD